MHGSLKRLAELPPETRLYCAHEYTLANARFAAPASQCPTIAPEWEDPKGVPIDAILFGGRRASAVPLVTEAFDWEHGVFMGSTVSSEQTAAAEGSVGELRRDPFAMLPFCGYNMGDYFRHWIKMQRHLTTTPRIFHVNWFRKDADGKFIWPGYGENSRVLKWVFERCEGAGSGTETPIGTVPSASDLDLDGLELKPGTIEAAVAVDADDWRQELGFIREHFDSIGERMPEALRSELAALESRLG